MTNFPLYANMLVLYYDKVLKQHETKGDIVMKKIIALVLALVMCAVVFVGCGEKEDDTLVCGVTIFENIIDI